MKEMRNDMFIFTKGFVEYQQAMVQIRNVLGVEIGRVQSKFDLEITRVASKIKNIENVTGSHDASYIPPHIASILASTETLQEEVKNHKHLSPIIRQQKQMITKQNAIIARHEKLVLQAQADVARHEKSNNTR